MTAQSQNAVELDAPPSPLSLRRPSEHLCSSPSFATNLSSGASSTQSRQLASGQLLTRELYTKGRGKSCFPLKTSPMKCGHMPRGRPNIQRPSGSWRLSLPRLEILAAKAGLVAKYTTWTGSCLQPPRPASCRPALIRKTCGDDDTRFRF
jgi:hypothetical protein